MSLQYDECFFTRFTYPRHAEVLGSSWIYVATVSKPIADSFGGYHIFRRFANDLSVPSYPRPGLTEMAKDFSKGCGREDQIHNGAHLSSNQPLVSSRKKGWHYLARLCAGSSKVMLQKNKARVVPFCMGEASKFRSNWVGN